MRDHTRCDRHPCPNAGRRKQVHLYCGYCQSNGRHKTNIPGHYGYVTERAPPIKPFEEYIMKRPDSKAAGGRYLGATAVDEAWVKKYPTILSFLCDETYDDGGARETSALSIAIRDGDFLLALNDKDLKQSVYTQAHTLGDGLKLMEDALAKDQAQWRPWNNGKKKKG